VWGEPSLAVTLEKVVDNTVVFRIELEEPTLELLMQALHRSFEEYLRARGCRRATYVNEEPRYIEVVEPQELIVIPDMELAVALKPVDHVMWIPKHRAEMYIATIEYVTEDGTTALMARTTIAVDRRTGVCWQHIDVSQTAVELATKEILALLEQA